MSGSLVVVMLVVAFIVMCWLASSSAESTVRMEQFKEKHRAAIALIPEHTVKTLIEVGDIVPAVIGKITDEKGVAVSVVRVLKVSQSGDIRRVMVRTPYGVLIGEGQLDGYVHCPDKPLGDAAGGYKDCGGFLVATLLKDTFTVDVLLRSLINLLPTFKELATVNPELVLTVDGIRQKYLALAKE